MLAEKFLSVLRELLARRIAKGTKDGDEGSGGGQFFIANELFISAVAVDYTPFSSLVQNEHGN